MQLKSHKPEAEKSQPLWKEIQIYSQQHSFKTFHAKGISLHACKNLYSTHKMLEGEINGHIYTHNWVIFLPTSTDFLQMIHIRKWIS